MPVAFTLVTRPDRSVTDSVVSRLCHGRQADETTRLIADAKACGLTCAVEKSTKTFINLEHFVATLKNLQPDQIVA